MLLLAPFGRSAAIRKLDVITVQRQYWRIITRVETIWGCQSQWCGIWALLSFQQVLLLKWSRRTTREVGNWKHSIHMTSPPPRPLCVVRRLGKGRKENVIFIGIPSRTRCGGESFIRASLTPPPLFMHQTARNCRPCLVICLIKLSIKFCCWEQLSTLFTLQVLFTLKVRWN